MVTKEQIKAELAKLGLKGDKFKAADVKKVLAAVKAKKPAVKTELTTTETRHLIMDKATELAEECMYKIWPAFGDIGNIYLKINGQKFWLEHEEDQSKFGTILETFKGNMTKEQIRYKIIEALNKAPILDKEGRIAEASKVMQLALLNVSKENSKSVDGNWIQNFTGTLEAAIEKANSFFKANPSSERKIAIVDDLGTNCILSYHTDVTPLAVVNPPKKAKAAKGDGGFIDGLSEKLKEKYLKTAKDIAALNTEIKITIDSTGSYTAEQKKKMQQLKSMFDDLEWYQVDEIYKAANVVPSQSKVSATNKSLKDKSSLELAQMVFNKTISWKELEKELGETDYKLDHIGDMVSNMELKKDPDVGDVDETEVSAKSKKWTIKDWAGNYPFQKGGQQGSGHLFAPENSFESWEDAEDFLSEKLGDKYDSDRGEYDIVEASLKNIDKIKNSLGKQIFDHIASLDKEGLKAQLSNLGKELSRIKNDKKDERYYKLKDEEWFLKYRLGASDTVEAKIGAPSKKDYSNVTVAAELKERIQNRFPNSTVVVNSVGPLSSKNVTVYFMLAKDKKDMPNGIEQNDLLYTIMSVTGFNEKTGDVADLLTAKMLLGHGAFINGSKVKSFDFKTIRGKPDKVITRIEAYFARIASWLETEEGKEVLKQYQKRMSTAALSPSAAVCIDIYSKLAAIHAEIKSKKKNTTAEVEVALEICENHVKNAVASLYKTVVNAK